MKFLLSIIVFFCIANVIALNVRLAAREDDNPIIGEVDLIDENNESVEVGLMDNEINNLIVDEDEEIILGHIVDSKEEVFTPEPNQNNDSSTIEIVESMEEDKSEEYKSEEIHDSIEIESNETLAINVCTGKTGYIADTEHCGMFYDCNNRDLVEGECPFNMWFDPNYEESLCNYPEVICANDNSVCDCATQYPPSPKDPLIEKHVKCLADNRFHLSPSTVDCGRYFICYNDNVIRQDCRSGLQYNEKTEKCDYPEIVNCRLPDPDCPAEGIRFLPDTKHCNVFYFCIHGYKTMQTCQFYHIWDIETSSCKRQDEVTCHLLKDK